MQAIRVGHERQERDRRSRPMHRTAEHGADRTRQSELAAVGGVVGDDASLALLSARYRSRNSLWLLLTMSSSWP